jgi:hypothetical protein
MASGFRISRKTLSRPVEAGAGSAEEVVGNRKEAVPVGEVAVVEVGPVAGPVGVDTPVLEVVAGTRTAGEPAVQGVVGRGVLAEVVAGTRTAGVLAVEEVIAGMVGEVAAGMVGKGVAVRLVAVQLKIRLACTAVVGPGAEVHIADLVLVADPSDRIVLLKPLLGPSLLVLVVPSSGRALPSPPFSPSSSSA